MTLCCAPELRSVNRSFGWLREPGTTGSRSRPELRVPGVARTSRFRNHTGFSESPETTGNRSFGWHRELGVTGDSGYPEFWVIHGTRDDSGNPFFLSIPRTCGDTGNPEFRVTPGTRCFWFLFQENLSSGWTGNPEFRVIWGMWSDSRKPFSGWLQEPWVPGDSGNPLFWVTPATQFCGDSGNQ